MRRKGEGKGREGTEGDIHGFLLGLTPDPYRGFSPGPHPSPRASGYRPPIENSWRGHSVYIHANVRLIYNYDVEY